MVGPMYLVKIRGKYYLYQNQGKFYHSHNNAPFGEMFGVKMVNEIILIKSSKNLGSILWD